MNKNCGALAKRQLHVAPNLRAEPYWDVHPKKSKRFKTKKTNHQQIRYCRNVAKYFYKSKHEWTIDCGYAIDFTSPLMLSEPTLQPASAPAACRARVRKSLGPACPSWCPVRWPGGPWPWSGHIGCCYCYNFNGMSRAGQRWWEWFVWHIEILHILHQRV